MRPDQRRGQPDRVRRARALAAANNLAAALDAWQVALEADPSSLDVAAGLADTAFRLSLFDLAEKFHAYLITHGRQDTATICAYAACLREQGRPDDAIGLLKSVVSQRQGESPLWEGLGAALLAKGERDTACTFFDEALRLDHGNLNALFHRGCARIEMGETRAGLADTADCARRFRDPANRASAELTSAHAALALGDLKAGWQWYEGRHMTGTPRQVTYDLALPRIPPAQPLVASQLSGKRLFISAEQGLGDEVLYASLLPDILAEVAHLGIGVEPRLVPLFQRSFPEVKVVAHHTETRDSRLRRTFPGLNRQDFDAWALMGDFLSTRRARIEDFPGTPFLTPDPERVAYWRRYLDELGPEPKAGLLWKSLKASHVRDRSFSPFEQWRHVLATPGIRFINLQYGDVDDDLAEARAAGFDIHVPETIDLMADLDDLSALTSALDVVMGPSNATSNIAAACGTRVWMVAPPRPWLALGQMHYPWYGSAKLFMAESLGDWAPVMARIAAALADISGGPDGL